MNKRRRFKAKARRRVSAAWRALYDAHNHPARWRARLRLRDLGVIGPAY